ncbi:MAG: phosphatase PAP2 family protein [Pseudomonadota bacterium]|nr:phosphatase PAP2 family protein [Pseudomonadota bacterium]
MLETYTHGLVNLLNSHPHWGTLLTFLIAFSESLAVIGTIIPGSVTMTAIGALVGAGVMSAGPTFAIATLGAFSGDLLSYWLGRHFDTRLAQMWPFRNHPEWLDKGKAFFAQHGAKSVILGRFMGPVRSIVIGALSAELPATTSAKFIVSILVGILIAWLLFWGTRLIMQKLWKFIDAGISRIWQTIRARPSWHWLTNPLADHREPDLHEQLILVFGIFITVILLGCTIYSVMHAGMITALNNPVYFLLQSFRTPLLDNIMSFITLLGERSVILPIAIAIFAWLCWRQHYRAAVHWLLLVLFIVGTVLMMKVGFYFPRPHPEQVSDTRSSFPSGHTALAMAIFSFLAFLIGRELHAEQKRYPYYAAFGITLLIAFSRVYLGAHWLSDVIASILLGLICMMVMILSYRRRHISEISPKALATVAGIIIALIWLPYATWQYPTEAANNSILWVKNNHVLTKWFGVYNPEIPILRNNRLGKAIEPLNIQWQGDLAKITAILQNHGWVIHSTALDLNASLRRLSLQAPHKRLPLLANLYHNHRPALLMTKTIPDKDYFLVLHLWPSDLTIADNPAPFWLGNVESHAATPSQKIADVIPEFKHDVANTQHKEIIVDTVTDPSIPKEWQWQRKILQILIP